MSRKRFNLTSNENNTEKVLKATKITCTGACGKEKSPVSFYTTTNPLYKSTGRFPVCKQCITNRLPDYRVNSQNELYRVIQDRSFVTSILSLLKSMNYPFLHKQWTIAINEAEKTGKHIFGLYLKHLAQVKEALNFDDGDTSLSSDDICRLSVNRGMTPEVLEEVKEVEKKKSKNAVQFEFDNEDSTITEDDVVLQKDLLRRLGYDPFIEYQGLDRKYLYQDLAAYLEDEGIVDDKFLVSMIIQIVKSNHQIKKIDDAIGILTVDTESLRANAAEIAKLATTKKSIQDVVNNLAKENKISVKNRTDAGLKKSTLGYKMSHYRTYGFKDAEENFYDMNVAKGVQVSAEISMASIFNQLRMTESDYADIIQKQATDLANAQKKILELEEDIRNYNVIIDAYISEHGKNKELIEYEK